MAYKKVALNFILIDQIIYEIIKLQINSHNRKSQGLSLNLIPLISLT